MACLFGHKWSGCKCAKCGKLRDKQHSWRETNCCSVCETCKTAKTDHKWVKKDDHVICEKCGIHGYKYDAEDAKYALKLISPVINQYGDKMYEFPYVYRSFIEKLNANKEIVLDAHEIAGYHLLLKTSFLVLTNVASPVAGGLMFGKKADASSIYTMDAAFKLRNEVRINLGILQKQLGFSDENDIDMSSPQIKKKLGMYLNE